MVDIEERKEDIRNADLNIFTPYNILYPNLFDSKGKVKPLGLRRVLSNRHILPEILPKGECHYMHHLQTSPLSTPIFNTTPIQFLKPQPFHKFSSSSSFLHLRITDTVLNSQSQFDYPEVTKSDNHPSQLNSFPSNNLQPSAANIQFINDPNLPKNKKGSDYNSASDTESTTWTE